MKNIILNCAIILVIPLMFGFKNGPEKKDATKAETMLVSCPRVINNSNCHVNFDVEIYTEFSSVCNVLCHTGYGHTVDGGNSYEIVCSDCLPYCEILIIINQVGSQSFTTVNIISNTGASFPTSFTVSGTPGCNATTISWNGTDFEIN